VTGASGLLGASLVAKAQEEGYVVTGVYYRHCVRADGVRALPADLTDEAEIRRIFEEVRPALVVHCAAATDVDWCEVHPEEAYKINVTVPSSIAEITSRSGARLLYISTDSVFDGESGDYSETDHAAPVNVYATTKLQAENEVLGQDPAAAIARVNLYGWKPRWNLQRKDSLAEWIVKQLTAGKPVPGFSDVRFCPVLVNDLAELLLALLERNFSGIFHVVGSESVSKYEFARRVASCFGFDPNQVVATSVLDAKLKARRPRDTSLNTSKLCAALERSMPDVDAGLFRFAQLRQSDSSDPIEKPGMRTRA
jgi:dTDP-4-dehydrorhamnose reductase